MSRNIARKLKQKTKTGILLLLFMYNPENVYGLEIVMGCKINGADMFILYDDKYDVIWFRYGAFNQEHQFVSKKRSGTAYTDFVVSFRNQIDGSLYEADFTNRLLRSLNRSTVLQCR